jgi:hypothetical protein
MRAAAILALAVLPIPSACGAEAAGSFALQEARASAAVFVGTLTNPDIREASGMAASRLRNDLLWVINDGGNEEFLYAVGLDGSDLGRVRVENASNVDWEDLASFRLDGEAFLMIADFGDNRGERRTKTLYWVPEPSLTGARFKTGRTVAWTRRIRFVFADGPRDCEGLGVDVRQKKILLLTKRTRPPQVYELALSSGDDGDRVRIAAKSAQIVHIPPPSEADVAQDPRFGPFRSQPTALDVSGDGRRVAILTYGNGVIYERRPRENWSVAFTRPPRLVVMPKLRQAEALCFSAGDDSLYVTSEKRPAPLYRIDLGR